MGGEDKKSVLAKFSAEQVEEFRGAFKLFDRDGDGTVTTKEIKDVMQMLGQSPSDEELKEMISEVDEDGSGEIEFEEFCLLMGKLMGITDEVDEFKEAFKLFDKDGNGLSTVDMKTVLESLDNMKLTDDELAGIIKELDPEGKGKISFDDYVKTFMFA